MARPAGTITVYYSPPSISEGAGHLAGHVFISVVDNRTGETHDLDVWSVDGVPFGSPVYLNDPTEDRREEEHSQQSWDLNLQELRDALNVINTYYETPQDYALIGNSCVTAVMRVLEAVDVPVDAMTPTGLWWDVIEIGEELPGYNHGVCEDHDIPDRISDPEWDPDIASSDPGAALFPLVRHDITEFIDWPPDQDDDNDEENDYDQEKDE